VPGFSKSFHANVDCTQKLIILVKYIQKLSEVGENGGIIIVQSLPKTHLMLTSPDCLPRVSQVVPNSVPSFTSQKRLHQNKFLDYYQGL
jgi:hypothetical protein